MWNAELYHNVVKQGIVSTCYNIYVVPLLRRGGYNLMDSRHIVTKAKFQIYCISGNFRGILLFFADLLATSYIGKFICKMDPFLQIL